MLINKIKSLLNESLDIDQLDIIDDSHRHKNHKQSTGGHFTVFIVSNDFESKTLIERHKTIYKILSLYRIPIWKKKIAKLGRVKQKDGQGYLPQFQQRK